MPTLDTDRAPTRRRGGGIWGRGGVRGAGMVGGWGGGGGRVGVLKGRWRGGCSTSEGLVAAVPSSGSTCSIAIKLLLLYGALPTAGIHHLRWETWSGLRQFASQIFSSNMDSLTTQICQIFNMFSCYKYNTRNCYQQHDNTILSI